jgi:2-polyprenyl-3-methyl-5-hydroxy-6-metoxy-1,4-benzoquinol methylase
MRIRRSDPGWGPAYFRESGTVSRWWDPLAGEDPNYRAWYLDQLEEVITVARPNGKRVLDAATGRGRTAIVCAQRGGTVVATDISSEMLKLARAAAVEHGLSDRIHFIKMDLEFAAFQPRSFDAILLLEVLLHLERPDRVLSHLFEALAPGGLLIVTTNGANPISRLLQPRKRGAVPTPRWKLAAATATNEVMTCMFGFTWHRTLPTRTLYQRLFNAPVRPLYPWKVKRMVTQAGFTAVYHRACPNQLIPREHRWAAYKAQR